MTTSRTWTDCEGVRRRDFLAVGTAGVLGLTLPELLRREARGATVGTKPAGRGQAKGVIMLWLAGGPATIDMWDLKPDAPEGIRGEFKPIATKLPGAMISEHLPKVASVLDKAILVRSLAHTIPSHAPATTFMTTGNKPTPALQFPSMGSVAAKLLTVPKGVPPYVTFGEQRNSAGLAGYLGTSYNPFIIEGSNAGKRKDEAAGGNLRVRGISLPNGFTLHELDNRDKLLQSFDQGLRAIDGSDDLVGGLDTFHQQALDILRSDRTKKAFDLASEPASLRESYGTDNFGQGVLAARRLIEAGVRFATVSVGGWDTHQKTFELHKKERQPLIDKAISTLLTDLDQRGMLDDTIVLVAGEFGRTPKINKNVGRDHWARSMAVLVAGGGLKRGYVHGSTDAQGMAPSTEPVTPDDLSATIVSRLGIDPTLEMATPTGRKVQLYREGRVIEKLLA
jgi:hypothetical protein